MFAYIRNRASLPLLLAVAAAFQPQNALAEGVARNRIAQAVDSGEVRVMAATAHPLARAEADRGRLESDRQIEGAALVFKLSAAQQSDLNSLLKQQQDRKSANYRKWLTPEQYAARFGMTESDLNKASAWLTSQGFIVTGTSRHHDQISFNGTALQMEAAFRTELHKYEVNGEMHFANATALSFPAALANVALSVENLNDFRPRAHNIRALRKPTAEPHPFFTSSYAGGHVMAPSDFWTIYNVSGYDGTGITIAVVGQTKIDTADLDKFRSLAGLPARTSANFQQILIPNSGADTVSSNDLPEADLDLEWTTAIAKNANTIYVYAGNTKNTFNALQYAIDNNVAPVISISYGNCEASLMSSGVTLLQQWAQAAVAQGQTISAATGDFGAADCEVPTGSNDPTVAIKPAAVDAPSSIPEVTGVGGSSFTADTGSGVGFWSSSGAALSYITEGAWNDTAGRGSLSAGGGGVSTMFAKPTWQTGTGVPADGHRDVPDIALNSSPEHDGYLVCTSGSCASGFATDNAIFGGTSVAAPAFAGILALANQASGSAGLGNINPTLYMLAVSDPAVFHDIKTGNNIVPCTNGSSSSCTGSATSYGFSAGVGYDQVTGLGSLNVGNLLADLNTNPNFTVDSTPVVISAPGGASTSTLTFNALNGYTGTVALSCSAPTSAKITCSLTPATLTLPGTTTATLTVTTTAGSGSGGGGTTGPVIGRALPAGQHSPNGWLTILGGSVAVGSLLAGVAIFPSATKRRRWTVLLSALTISSLALLGACGGSSGSKTSGGTPVGTYQVTVTATDSSNSVTHNSAVSVQVQ